jgi:hypothetical protein
MAGAFIHIEISDVWCAGAIFLSLWVQEGREKARRMRKRLMLFENIWRKKTEERAPVDSSDVH